METSNWVQIVVIIVLLVLSGFFAGKWQKAKVLLKETAEALTATSEVLADDKVTSEERQLLLKEWADVITAAKDLLNK